MQYDYLLHKPHKLTNKFHQTREDALLRRRMNELLSSLIAIIPSHSIGKWDWDFQFDKPAAIFTQILFKKE